MKLYAYRLEKYVVALKHWKLLNCSTVTVTFLVLEIHLNLAAVTEQFQFFAGELKTVRICRLS